MPLHNAPVNAAAYTPANYLENKLNATMLEAKILRKLVNINNFS